MAIHRTGWGSSFADSPKLQAGDKIYLETADGFYTYIFRNNEYVLPLLWRWCYQSPAVTPQPVIK